MVIHTARYGEKGECDLLMHRPECKSVELAPVTWIPIALGSAKELLAQCAHRSRTCAICSISGLSLFRWSMNSARPMRASWMVNIFLKVQ